MEFDKLMHPDEGERIIVNGDGSLTVPSNPIIPFIEGDGVGPDIMRATKIVLDGAVEKIYQGSRKIEWFEIFAGEKAFEKYGEYLPEDTFEAIAYFKVAIKGPLTTPVGGGFRSLNVTLRQKLDLYSCVRPCVYIPGVPSPVKDPRSMKIIIFRENTEDVYAGIEWKNGSEETEKLREFLKSQLNVTIRPDASIGLKPISMFGTKRLVRAAIKYAIDKQLPSVTLMHKGNIMKFTEGFFKEWGYQVAVEEFRPNVVTERELWDKHGGQMPEGKVLIKDRIADSMFQQVLTRTSEYSVVATSNLNGDYLSDACAAQIGGLGMAPGANIGDEIALFEATHGTAPKYTNMDKINPTSLILSGVMMLEHLEWFECAGAIRDAIERTIKSKKVTYDLARLMDGVSPIKTSEYAREIVKNIG
ncbi:MAG: isocitrate dehydrogenase (NADP(+)) [Promethearchaeota archaeon]